MAKIFNFIREVSDTTKSMRNLTLLCILSFLPLGCGFNPTNLHELPRNFKRIYYEGTNIHDSLHGAMVKRLKLQGVVLLPQPEKNAPSLKLTYSYFPNLGEHITSTQARIYILSYAATVAIIDINDKIILGPETVNVSRNVTLQPNEVFEVTSQISVVKGELQRELIDKIFNILASQKTELLLRHWYHES